jgi:transglutaminase-like putative cysteine protease
MTEKVLSVLGTMVLVVSFSACPPQTALSGEPPKEPAATRGKNIQDRFVPPVAGIDLEQALNYVDSEGIDLAWFYRSFTCPRVFYKVGSRPFLEKIVWEQTKPDAPPMDRLQACVAYVANRMPHYIRLGYNGATDRALTEEDLLRSGHGWCNEQARVLVALTQISEVAHFE